MGTVDRRLQVLLRSALGVKRSQMQEKRTIPREKIHKKHESGMETRNMRTKEVKQRKSETFWISTLSTVIRVGLHVDFGFYMIWTLGRK